MLSQLVWFFPFRRCTFVTFSMILHVRVYDTHVHVDHADDDACLLKIFTGIIITSMIPVQALLVAQQSPLTYYDTYVGHYTYITYNYLGKYVVEITAIMKPYSAVYVGLWVHQYRVHANTPYYCKHTNVISITQLKK